MVKLLCAGNTPAEVVPFLCGAILLACQKKGGGLRPIAVGEVLRRLSSKCLSRAVQSDAFRPLSPLQVGVGVKASFEAIVHSVTRTLEDPNIQPEEHWILFLDYSNAFNSISRGTMFQEVRACIPAAMELSLFCIWGTEWRPAGRSSRPVDVWYLDDGTLCGSPNNLLKIVEEDGPVRGLHLNHAKSLLFIPNDADSSCNLLPSDTPRTQRISTCWGRQLSTIDS